VRLRAATSADFAAIRAMAQLPQHALLITDEDEAALAAYLADPTARLFMVQIAQDDSAGFALFCDLHNPARTIELRRLALRQTGLGQGRAFVQLLTDTAFDDFGAARVWLDTNHDNIRAQKVYEAVGYRHEGTLRRHGYCAPLNIALDQWIYGILREEWAKPAL
jgi:RimJ/RimL family protein N-acetyltransferase